jgi:hypothetical protein
MLGAHTFTVKLITAITTIILSIANIGLIDTVAVTAVFAAPWTRLDLAHKRE